MVGGMADAGGYLGQEGAATAPAAAVDTTRSMESMLEDIRHLHAAFTAEPDWEQFYQPPNLLLALVGEVKELAELLQWKNNEEPGPQAWPARNWAALEEELSDILIYLVALEARCHMDLPCAVLSKMDTNRRRYTVHLSHTSAWKYTDLGQEAASEDHVLA